MDRELTKLCNGCGFELPAREFRSCASARDGLRGKCKECERGYDKARSASRAEYRKENRDWDRHTEIVRDWRERNREKMRAHGAVRRALKRGDLVRPYACEKCGRDDCRLEAHHDDYSKPLDVKWLCDPCHKQRHVELRLEARPFQDLRWNINQAIGGAANENDDPPF